MSLAFLKLRSNPRFQSGFILSSVALQQIKPQCLNLFRRFASAAVSNQATNNTLFFAKKTYVVQYQQRRPFGRVNIPDLSATDASLESFVEEQLLEGEEGEVPSESLLWKKDSELTPEQQKIKRWELWRSPFIAYAATTGANAALSEKIKIKMWETYKSDPKFWTLGNLSGKFKVSAKRAYAIIVDKRHEEIEEIIAGKPLDSSLLDKFEKEFAHFIFDELPEEMEHDDTVSKGKPNYEFVDYEVPQYKAASLYRKMRQTGFGVLIKDELPDQPPLKAMDGLEVLRSQPLVLRKGTKSPEDVAALRKAHNIPEGGGKLTIMDSGLGRHNYKREIYVLEMDGTIRTGSWQERKDLNKQPPRKNLQTRFESEMQFLEDYLKKSLEENARLAKDPAEQERLRLWREKVDREERRANERKAKAKAEADKALADAHKAVTDAVIADAQKKLQEDPKLLKL